MGMQINDTGRDFIIDVDAAGAVFIRKRGAKTKRLGMPVFSTDTEEEAERIRVRHCRLARDGSGVYFLNDPPRTVEDLGKVSDLFRATYAGKVAKSA